jgi:5-methylcytosine-specific restriction protein A
MSRPPRIGVIPYRGKGICRGCGGGVPKGRQTWCSDRCVTEALIRKGDPAVVRREVFRRDQGVCSGCGLDCAQVERVLSALEGAGRGHISAEDRAQRQAARIFLYRQLFGGQKVRHLWEADHVVPVAEGGGGCGLEGYRTMCLLCHRAESAKLVRRLADARRIERPRSN